MDAINENIHKETNVNQWENTAQVINWFKKIKSKKVSSFVNFDGGNFFPFISIDLLTDAISYAKTITIIDDNELLKTTGGENFGVPMGCYDGVEVCELVGHIF